MPPKKVNTPFHDSHKLAWGVELISTSGDGGVTVRCMFCEYIGRDAAEIGPTTNRKRKARSSSHYYTAPFTSAKYKSLVTRMVAAAENPVLRIWRAPHQIDLVVKKAAKSVADGAWIKFTWSSIFLRKQANLNTRVNAKCPKQTSWWTHLGRLLTFLKSYRRLLIEF
ncbi:hypothetical protein ACHHYP_06113 [Achlya hypogyna]|uniref:Uncharacterized protein n=1 Tax=Achlya hypogyna TaxID=1202772 RepID=A0A1V9YV45_ACHHY|nr:hypothetical protein ACHHYP_06113 [Achlya hypogyna]